MRYNSDGTQWCLETVEEVINSRCEKSDYPGLSDVIGSDWACNVPVAHNPEQYRKNALAVASRIYKYACA